MAAPILGVRALDPRPPAHVIDTARDLRFRNLLLVAFLLDQERVTPNGSVYFAAEMLGTKDDSLEGKACLVSGSGNVSQYATEKILDLGGKIVTMSDSGGYIYDEAGIDREKLA